MVRPMHEAVEDLKKKKKKELVREALTEANGRINPAAKMLVISPITLRTYLTKWGWSIKTERTIHEG
jgi:DNA-binding NtrC family response regulator